MASRLTQLLTHLIVIPGDGLVPRADPLLRVGNISVCHLGQRRLETSICEIEEKSNVWVIEHRKSWTCEGLTVYIYLTKRQ